MNKVTIKASVLSAAIRAASKAMPTNPIIAINEYILVDTKMVCSISNEIAYRQDLSATGSGQVLVHSSVWPVLMGMSGEADIVLTNGRAEWQGGHITAPEAAASDYPAWPAIGEPVGSMAAADLKGALDAVKGALDPMESDLSAFYPVYIEKGHIAGGSKHSFAISKVNIDNEGAEIPISRDHLAPLSAWLSQSKGEVAVMAGGSMSGVIGDGWSAMLSRPIHKCPGFVDKIKMVFKKPVIGDLDISPDFKRAMSIVASVTRGHSAITLDISEGNLTISGRSETGTSISQRASATCSANDMTIHMNSKQTVAQMAHAETIKFVDIGTATWMLFIGPEYWGLMAPIVF